MRCFPQRHQLWFLVVVTLGVVEISSTAKIVNSVSLVCDLTCKSPQPRAIRMMELINVSTRTAPYMTVVHRCDEGSGCCTLNTICKVAHWETLKLKVYVFEKRYVERIYEIKNHTECSCQNINDHPK